MKMCIFDPLHLGREKVFYAYKNLLHANRLYLQSNETAPKFNVCNNAMKIHKINKEDLFEFCEVVPAGITKLVELQMDGYAYVKP